MAPINLSLATALKGAGFIVLVFVLYAYLYKPDLYVKADELTSHTEAVERTVEHVVDTVSPDGTHVTETTTVKETAKVKDLHTESSITAPVTGTKSQYRVGLDYLPSLDRAPSASDVAVRAGARVGNSPVWVEVEIDLKHKQGSIGISAEF